MKKAAVNSATNHHDQITRKFSRMSSACNADRKSKVDMSTFQFVASTIHVVASISHWILQQLDLVGQQAAIVMPAAAV